MLVPARLPCSWPCEMLLFSRLMTVAEDQPELAPGWVASRYRCQRWLVQVVLVVAVVLVAPVSVDALASRRREEEEVDPEAHSATPARVHTVAKPPLCAAWPQGTRVRGLTPFSMMASTKESAAG